jgi:hypothetical protein
MFPKVNYLSQDGLLAGVQAQLLSGIPTLPNDSFSRNILNALQLFSYAGLATNIGAALSSMVYLSISEGEEEEEEELGNGQSFAFQHCVISTCIGASCLLLEILLLSWASSKGQETHPAIFAMVVLASAWALAPFPGHLIYSFFRGVKQGFQNPNFGKIDRIHTQQRHVPLH